MLLNIVCYFSDIFNIQILNYFIVYSIYLYYNLQLLTIYSTVSNNK